MEKKEIWNRAQGGTGAQLANSGSFLYSSGCTAMKISTANTAPKACQPQYSASILTRFPRAQPALTQFWMDRPRVIAGFRTPPEIPSSAKLPEETHMPMAKANSKERAEGAFG